MIDETYMPSVADPSMRAQCAAFAARPGVQRGLWLIAAVLFYVSIYFPLCAYLQGHATAWLPVFAWERALPLVPQAIYGYLTLYVVMFIPCFQIEGDARFRNFVQHYFVLTTIHFLIFLCCPSAMDRPLLQLDGSVTLRLLDFYYHLDPPQCIFPSLHVSYSLLATLALWHHKPAWGKLCAVLTALVGVCVLLVKQHYAIDVIAAVLLTSLIWRIMPKPVET